ncbi:hypothetical protein COBT_001993, partial [Conglomerata obtusa]
MKSYASNEGLASVNILNNRFPTDSFFINLDREMVKSGKKNNPLKQNIFVKLFPFKRQYPYRAKKTRFVRDIYNFETHYTEGEFLPNKFLGIDPIENIEKLKLIKRYVTDDIEYANNMFFLIQNIIPNVSPLTANDIMHPNTNNLREINRIRHLLELRGEIAGLNIRINTVGIEIRKFENNKPPKPPIINAKTAYNILL